MIRKIESSPDKATWTEITGVLADGLEPGTEEAQTYQMGDGTTEQEGVISKGEFKATGVPAYTPGTRYWFRFTDHAGTTKTIGGTDGCRVVVSKTSLRPVGGGPAYSLVQFSCAGGTGGSTIV